MGPRRPELVETIVAWSGLSPWYVENSTRLQMEADQLLTLKGRRTQRSRYYGPREGSVALIGVPGGSDAPDFFTKLSILRADPSPADTFADPIGRLLPSLPANTPDCEEDLRLELHAALTAVLGNISALSPEQASALRRNTDPRSVCLELCTAPETALFRWTSEGEERVLLFKHPGTPFAEILEKDPPAYQTVTKLYFPLIFAVGRLFAAAPAHNSADPDPSSGEATASTDLKKGNAARPGAALPGDRSRNSRTRAPTRAKVWGGGEILKPVPLSLDRLPLATPVQEGTAIWARPTT